jgi:hypothetical protein
MPTKNFFPSSLTPTRSSHYPFLYTTHKHPLSNSSTGMSLNCTSPNHPPSSGATCTSLNCTIPTYSPILESSTSTSLNCNFTQTLHDMPGGLDGGLMGSEGILVVDKVILKVSNKRRMIGNLRLGEVKSSIYDRAKR